MSNKSKLIITISILIVIAFSAYAFPIIKNRYFSAPQNEVTDKESDESEILEESDDVEELTPEEEFTDEELDDSEEITDEDLGDEEDLSVETSDGFLEILSSDCKDGCVEFTEPEDIKYCKEYCGPSKTTITSPAVGCDSLEDLDRDYCLKNDAVAKKDFQICEKIEDSGIKKACSNQITQEIPNQRGEDVAY